VCNFISQIKGEIYNKNDREQGSVKNIWTLRDRSLAKLHTEELHNSQGLLFKKRFLDDQIKDRTGQATALMRK
jgi:hypothetical protein